MQLSEGLYRTRDVQDYMKTRERVCRSSTHRSAFCFCFVNACSLLCADCMVVVVVVVQPMRAQTRACCGGTSWSSRCVFVFFCLLCSVVFLFLHCFVADLLCFCAGLQILFVVSGLQMWYIKRFFENTKGV